VCVQRLVVYEVCSAGDSAPAVRQRLCDHVDRHAYGVVGLPLTATESESLVLLVLCENWVTVKQEVSPVHSIVYLLTYSHNHSPGRRQQACGRQLGRCFQRT
jgi:hypothetical protein